MLIQDEAEGDMAASMCATHEIRFGEETAMFLAAKFVQGLNGDIRSSDLN